MSELINLRRIEKYINRQPFERCKHNHGTVLEDLTPYGYRLRCKYCGKVASTVVFPAPECACVLPEQSCSVCRAAAKSEEIPF